MIVAAAVLAGGMAAAGGGLGAGGGSAGTAADSVLSQDLRARTSKGKSEARNGRYRQAWRQLGWRGLKRWGEQAANCAVHSYGQVREFFLRTPCRSLRRRLLLLGDDKGNTIVVAIAWVRMPGRAEAGSLKELADTHGTGNVTPRAATALDLAGVRFTGRYYHSDRRAATTVIAEAEPASGAPDGATMDAVAEIAVLFPAPR